MSWEQLLAIEAQNREWRQEYATAPPVACPNDGTPLEEGPGGELFCRHDGWQYPRDWTPPEGL